MKLWIQVVAIVCCLFVQMAASTCPTCNINPYNLTAQEATAKYVQLVPNIWNQSIALTPLAISYRTIVENLTTRPRNNGFATSIYTSLFANNFIPYLNQQPDACFMATMINASLSCIVDHNQTLLQDALNQLKDSYLYDINPRLERTLIHKSGCDVRCGEFPPDPQVKKTDCYMNGFVYPIQEIWELSRNRLSSSLEYYTWLLYDTSDFNDNFLAAVTTFALLEAPRKVFELLNRNIIAEVTELTLSSPIEPKCCHQRILRAEEIRKIYDAAVISAIDSVKQHYATTRCA